MAKRKSGRDTLVANLRQEVNDLEGIRDRMREQIKELIEHRKQGQENGRRLVECMDCAEEVLDDDDFAKVKALMSLAHLDWAVADSCSSTADFKVAWTAP